MLRIALSLFALMVGGVIMPVKMEPFAYPAIYYVWRKLILNKPISKRGGSMRVFAAIGKPAVHAALCMAIVAAIGMSQATAAGDSLKSGGTAGVQKAAVAGDSLKVASKDTAAKLAKCPMMADTSKKKCAMMHDSSKKKCPMICKSSKVKGCYTCAMHPDVMKKEAGKCPMCGMDLVFQKCVMDSSKANGRGRCCKMKK
jgi:hypothetical protein